MVNWKEPGTFDRLIGALLAAHPELKPDYHAIARMFGRGATYNAVEGQFRKFREMAKALAAESQGNGFQASPRPRSVARGSRTQAAGVKKPVAKPKKSLKAKNLKASGKFNTNGSLGQSLLGAININNSDEEDDHISIKSETAFANDDAVNVKDEETTMQNPISDSEKIGSCKNGYEAALRGSNVAESEDEDFSEYA
ncbi:hypothetical protein BGW36DRAFT_357867 [Talaromyces proteolyticus]|uniref:Uncharacterized protein n=1 Tax=Talaromyces proteolyticus TaxID=1131652 RepID=A0AAD4KWA1_9EURO|nr:uncharacterized protein BGW36DRAFT_357867 [Talaromyces proteolyticus]KAH8698328.1 hypothetical protein BGW36DRAFT_357867 [Talaromyces proteolyticus]